MKCKRGAVEENQGDSQRLAMTGVPQNRGITASFLNVENEEDNMFPTLYRMDEQSHICYRISTAFSMKSLVDSLSKLDFFQMLIDLLNLFQR